jgi:hypothetical protein
MDKLEEKTEEKPQILNDKFKKELDNEEIYTNLHDYFLTTIENNPIYFKNLQKNFTL